MACGTKRIERDVEIRRVDCPRCGKVETESLRWLATNTGYTKRLAMYVGGRCRESSVEAVAVELHLDWKAVKEMEKQYMTEQLRRNPVAAPKVIGVD